VAAFGEARVALRARARGVAAAVDLALEGRAAFRRAEGEARVRGRRGVRRTGVDRRVGSDAVDSERAARGRFDEVDVVGRAHANRVGAVSREARSGEGVGPVPAGKACRVPGLAPRAERAGAPVVGRALADGDLHLLDAGAARAVAVGAAEAVRTAAGIPARGRVGRPGGGEGRRRGRRRRVDLPRVAGRRSVRVPRGVGRAHEERVVSVGERAGVALRARARGVAAAVDLAFEGRAALGRGKAEARARRGRRVGGIGRDRRVRSGGVVRERAAVRRLDEADVVRRPHANGVGVVGGEVRGRERVRPVAGRERRRVPDLAARAEGARAPVVARVAPDRDLHLLDARAARAVAVGAAEAVRAAACVPAGGVVASARGRECRRRARRGVVDSPVGDRRRVAGVARPVGGDRAEVVEAVGDRRRVEGDGVRGGGVGRADVRPRARAGRRALELHLGHVRIGIVGRRRLQRDRAGYR